MTLAEPLWTPTATRVARTRLAEFARFAHHQAGAPRPPESNLCHALHEWSVEHPERFWPAVWHFTGVIAEEREGQAWDEVLVGGNRMAPPDPVLGPRWFTGARLNFAENLLRYRDDDREALIFWNERGRQRSLTFRALSAEAARIAGGLRAAGVRPGDRVAGYLPNIPETVVAMLATASLGAVWSSCSPDFGTRGVLDRFGQIEPKVLVVADGYLYGGQELDRLDRVREISTALPSVVRVLVVPHLREEPEIGAIRNGSRWNEFGTPGRDAPLFERLPFDHPLYVMYSSGTTGFPKCMVHGAGGTLLQHLKEHVLHTDLSRESTLFYFTTCGWMMWNWLVSALAVGARVVLYDGSPLVPPTILWDMAASERVTVFGTSAKYLALSEKEGVTPAGTHDLSALCTILSTGSPLAAHSCDYVYRSVKPVVQLASISGGTDIISCFALGDPTASVHRGEIQTRGLGMAVDVWDGDGRPVVGRPGELVCTRPFPSMPVRFWNDADGDKYREAYFEHYRNAWRHGDWAERTPHDGLVIHGRSDATLNPGGVRIGTAEIYREVERIPEVLESLAVEQEEPGGPPGEVRVVLFVRLRDGVELDDALRARITQAIRDHTSPHHVPRKIVRVGDIPRTVSGKITELAVRDMIHGRPVQNREALANPEALELYRAIPELAR